MFLLDDLNDYKLETSFQNEPQCILHTSFTADRARGISKVAVVQKWVPQKPYLGAGTFGIVHLEELEEEDARVISAQLEGFTGQPVTRDNRSTYKILQ
jgi:hypothetical protein